MIKLKTKTYVIKMKQILSMMNICLLLKYNLQCWGEFITPDWSFWYALTVQGLRHLLVSQILIQFLQVRERKSH